jgi:MarR family transcriptional regulator, organic hydroperoxide resistance regulator
MTNFLFDDKYYALWGLLCQTRDALVKARQKELDTHNISQSRVAVLHIISTMGNGVTPGQIALWLFRQPHSISEILTSMEKEGLITKSRDPQKQNVVHLSITDKGREMYKKSTERTSIHNIMSDLTEEEREQLHNLLLKVLKRSLKEMGDQHMLPWSP